MLEGCDSPGYIAMVREGGAAEDCRSAPLDFRRGTCMWAMGYKDYF